MRNIFVLCCAFTIVLALPHKDTRNLSAILKSAEKTAEQVETLTKTIVSLNGVLDPFIDPLLDPKIIAGAELFRNCAEIPGAEMYFQLILEAYNSLIDILKTLRAEGISYSTTLIVLLNSLEQDIVTVLSKYANKVNHKINVVKFYRLNLEGNDPNPISQENYTKISANVGNLFFLGRAGLSMARKWIQDLDPSYFQLIVNGINQYLPLAGNKLGGMLAQFHLTDTAVSVKVMFEAIAKDFIAILNILESSGNSPYDVLYQIVNRYFYNVLRDFNDLAYIA